MKSVMRAVLILALVVTTHLITKKLIASAVRSTSPKSAGEVATLRLAQPGEIQAAPRLPDRSGLLRSASLTGFKVTSLDGQIFVNGSARVDSKSPNGSFLWRMVVLRESDKAVLMDIPYWERAIDLDAPGSILPTFTESFRPGPGVYRVVLSLHSLSRDHNRDVDLDLDQFGATMGLRAFQVIRCDGD